MRFWVAVALAALALPSVALQRRLRSRRRQSKGRPSRRQSRKAAFPICCSFRRDIIRAERDRWPLLIFLHGSGERGTDINVVKKHGPPMLVEKNPAFPFIVISPQLPGGIRRTSGEFWPIPPLEAILDHAMKTLRVDPSRVYLTGPQPWRNRNLGLGHGSPRAFRGAGAGRSFRRPEESLQCQGRAGLGLPWRS